MAKAFLSLVRPVRIHGVDATLEQLKDQTRELFDSITREAQAARRWTTCPQPFPPMPLKSGRVECPSCHILNAIHTYAHYGRTSYCCPNCDHSWSVAPL